MIGFVPLSPCVGAALVWRQGSCLALSAIVKATYALPGSGALELCEPQPLAMGDTHTDDLPTRGVRTPSDWVPFRPLADVTLVGRAHALTGPVQSMHVRLTVIDGDRLLVNKTLAICDELPFSSMPVEYERAVGGLGRADNPIGVGGMDGDAPPNVLHAREPDRPAAFAPIPAMWAARRALRGAFSRRALTEPIVVLPPTFDHAYFQSAPPDQRCAYLLGTEAIVLEGLHPDATQVHARLPRLQAHGVVFGPGVEERQPLTFVIDGLHIDTDRRQCTVTWRARVDGVVEEALPGYLIAAGVSAAGRPLRLPQSRRDVVVQANVASGMDGAPFVVAQAGARPAPQPLAGAPWSTEPVQVVLAPVARQNATLTLGMASVSGTLPVVHGASPTETPFALARAGSARPGPKRPWPPMSGEDAPPRVRAQQRSTLPIHHETDEAIASVLPAASAPTSEPLPPTPAPARPVTPWATGPELGEPPASSRRAEPRRLPERLDARALLYRSPKGDK